MLNEIADRVHKANSKWWLDMDRPCSCTIRTVPVANPDCQHCGGTGYLPKQRNVGELLMLCVSELAEAMEGDRKGLQDDKLPEYRMFDVEIVDCFIRLFDIAAGMGIDLDEVFEAKMEYNSVRADHKLENRRLAGGKKY